MKEDITIISLFDYTGNWSLPYLVNGYHVVQVDIKHAQDIMTLDYKKYNNLGGVLAAVPCTNYALSGAKWFKEKDADGRTEDSNLLVKKTMEIIRYFNPMFWVIENPMSRIHKLNPEIGQPVFKFHPYEFAQYDPIPRNSQYQKMTWLFGKFNPPIKKPLPPIDGQKYFRKLGGKSERTKELRSATPLGFSWAYYEANQIELSALCR